MLLKKSGIVVCLCMLMSITVYANYEKSTADANWLGKYYSFDVFVSNRVNYYIEYSDIREDLEIIYYYPLRYIMEMVGAEVIWGWGNNSVKVTHNEKEFYVEFEETAHFPARGNLTMWVKNENEKEYIINNENKKYENYVVIDNHVYISMRPDLVNLLELINYSVEISNEYSEKSYVSFGEYIETMGSPNLWIYSNPPENEIGFCFQKKDYLLKSPALIYKNNYYVPLEETLELGGVRIGWNKDDWYYGGYYVFEGNRDIPTLACFGTLNNSWEVVLYDEKDHEYLNAKSYHNDMEAYERIRDKVLSSCQEYIYNDKRYVKLEDIDYILNYFGNYKIYADKNSKTVHMERKGLKTP